MTRIPGRPLRILYQEITPALIRRASAMSARASSGGGARDLRLRPNEKFLPLIQLMLSKTFGIRGQQAHRGIATWGDGAETRRIEYQEPTKTRPTEGRIVRINLLDPLANFTGRNRGVVLFVQDDRDMIWVRTASFDEIEQSEPIIADPILWTVENIRPGWTATGYIDLTEGGLGIWSNSGNG